MPTTSPPATPHPTHVPPAGTASGTWMKREDGRTERKSV